MGAQAGVNPMQQAMALQQNPELMAQMLDNPVQSLWRVARQGSRRTLPFFHCSFRSFSNRIWRFVRTYTKAVRHPKRGRMRLV